MWSEECQPPPLTCVHDMVDRCTLWYAVCILYIIVLHVQDVETVVGDISGAIQQLKNLSDVTLDNCCDELTRGVVGGVVVSQCIQTFSMGTYYSESAVLVNVLYTYGVCSVATACTVCVMICTPLQERTQRKS